LIRRGSCSLVLLHDALVSLLYYEVVLAKFPPTFLISAARDFSSSNSSHSSLRILLHAIEAFD
jgi:hypothetical protein